MENPEVLSNINLNENNSGDEGMPDLSGRHTLYYRCVGF